MFEFDAKELLEVPFRILNYFILLSLVIFNGLIQRKNEKGFIISIRNLFCL